MTYPRSGLKATRSPRDAVVESRRGSCARAAGARSSRARRARTSRPAAAPRRSPCAPSARRGTTVPNALGGHSGTRPKVGLSPGRPQKPHGMRIEPAPSLPSASGTRPAASAAALPPLEPPGVVAGSHGLRVTPYSGLSVTPFQPNSGDVVWPGSTAPLRRSAATAERVLVPRPGRVDRARAAPRRPAARRVRVLDRDGHAVQRAERRAALPALLGGACLGQRALGVDEAEGVERVGLDPRQQRLEDLDRRQAPLAERDQQLSSRSGRRSRRNVARGNLVLRPFGTGTRTKLPIRRLSRPRPER